MGFRELVTFVLVRHLTLASNTALLFVVGILVAVPVIRWRVKALQWVLTQESRLRLRLMGRRPTILRRALTAWLFDSGVTFIYMASGFHSFVPKALTIWAGLALAVGIVAIRREKEAAGVLSSGAEGHWTPPPQMVLLCSYLDIIISLLSFWYVMAMGISLGWQVQRGEVAYLAGLGLRATAFLLLIVPAGLVIAVLQAVADRGDQNFRRWAKHRWPKRPRR